MSRMCVLASAAAWASSAAQAGSAGKGSAVIRGVSTRASWRVAPYQPAMCKPNPPGRGGLKIKGLETPSGLGWGRRLGLRTDNHYVEALGIIERAGDAPRLLQGDRLDHAVAFVDVIQAQVVALHGQQGVG